MGSWDTVEAAAHNVDDLAPLGVSGELECVPKPNSAHISAASSLETPTQWAVRHYLDGAL
jgi:hypothetical protein